MPGPNEALKDFFKDNDAYADAFNAVFYGGEERFRGKDLSEGDTVYENTLEVDGSVIKFRRYRDIVRVSRDGVSFVILCVEAQDRVHYAQPLREMIYDALGYLEQVKSVTLDEERKLWTSDEFLSRLPRDARIKPIMSIVVYTGEKPWDGPLTLHDMLDMDEDLKRFVPDYPMTLIDLGHDPGYHFNTTKLRELSEALTGLYAGNRDELRVGRETLALAAVLARDAKLYRKVNKLWEGEDVDMGSILDKWDREAEARGIKIGEARGVAKMLIMRLNEIGKVSKKLEKRIMGVEDQEILVRWFDDVKKYSSVEEFTRMMG